VKEAYVGLQETITCIKNPRKGSKSESRLVLKVGCGIKN
jgi:hypothetical protein